MSFMSLVVKNPFRSKTRSSLAIIGIAIGIATIVALGMVTGGLKASTETTLKAGGADITVIQNNSGGGDFNSGSSSIAETRVTSIRNISGIKDAAGILRASTIVAGSSMPFSITGINLDKLYLAGVDNVNGTKFSNGSANEIIIGKTVAQSLNKKVNDTISLYGKDFKITGIFETGNFMQDGGAFMSLNTLQNLTSRDGEVSGIYVKVNDNANVNDVSKSIEDAYPKLSTITAQEQFQRINNTLSTIDTATWAISLLAIVIGGVGVINTMIMSVFERTREIGVLKAVGWRSRRILGMILGESIALTLIAAVVGTIMGIIGVELLLSYSSTAGAFIKPVYTLDIFIRAFGIAFLVGVIGGLYPAYRASRLPPTEALRYE